jgi:hypothetical protein
MSDVKKILEGLSPGDKKTLLAELLAEDEAQQRASRRTNSGHAYIKVRPALNVRYMGDDDGRIVLQFGDPLQVWEGTATGKSKWVDLADALTLPGEYGGSGKGWWVTYSLSPTSADYHPENWVRWNRLLEDLGAPFGKQLAPKELRDKPARDLRSRASELLQWLAPTAAPKVSTKPTKSDGQTKTEINREVTARILVALKSDAQKWNPKSHHGISRETYIAKIAEYMDYLPVPLDAWDVGFWGHKEGRGGRPTTRAA